VRREHAAELAAIGHPFTELLGWAYPPAFLFVVAGLACLPYVPGYILWCATTLAFQASVVAAIARDRAALLIACAMPWVPIEFLLGQNGLLTAALIGLAFVLFEKRPLLGGIALGLLICKPQFGVLFPLALVAGGHWRAFWAAAATAVAVNVAAGFAFGFATFGAFFHALSDAAGSHLLRSDLGWNKLQSIYGLLRWLGAPGTTAWTAQALLCAMLAAGVVFCWRSRDIPYPLKAALLAAAVPLATPYIFYYDVPVLAVAAAFLWRHRAFDKFELAVVAFATLWLFAPFLVNAPSALLVTAALMLLALRRCYATLPWTRIRPSWVTDATSLPSSE
jgi:arabinofuranan 3-O-arabinosyltransferase